MVWRKVRGRKVPGRERSYVGGNSDFYWVLIPLERKGGKVSK